MLAAVVVVGLGAWQGVRLWLGPGVVVDRAARGALIETVVATGNVETPYRVTIGSQITGTVEQVLVEEGVRVTEGQPLIALESRELKAAVVQAKGAVAQAEARTRQIDELTLPTARESRKEAQATLLNAQQTFDRASDLIRSGFATRVALDTAKRDLDVARTQVRSAEVQVFTDSPGGSDYVMAGTALNQARAALDTATSRLAYATIAAPRAGVLITRNVERGSVVQPGNVLLVLAPDGDTQLLLAIDERNLGKLALGQSAVVSADAYPDKRFPAVVSYINPAVDITRASVEVKLTVPDPPAYLRQDMTVSVDIEVARRAEAVVLPVRSVRDVLSGDPWIMKIRNGRAFRQPVRLGLQGNTQIEVLSGIDEGESAIPTNAGVLTGAAAEADHAVNRWLPFEWIAAIRFLREGRMQTMFIISGIAIGVGVIVFMSALLTGLQANFIKRVLTSQPQIQLIPPDQVARPLRFGPGNIESAVVQRPSQRVLSVDQWPKIRDRMLARPDVTAVSPTMAGSALSVRGAASRAIAVSGIEPATYFTIVRVPDYVVAGEPRLTSQDIIIGTELAKDLGATVGDKLNIEAASGAPVVLTVTALVDLGNKGVNERNTYVALRTAQSLLGVIGGVTTIDMTVKDIYAAETMARDIQASNAVEADSWIKTNAQFFTAVEAQKTSNTMIRLFVALSVAFGIAAVLVVSVIQRSKDIGILRAMGTTRGQILRIFLIQGGVLGFVGAVAGSATGAGGLIYWHSAMRQADGTELFPLVLERNLFIATAILATLTGLLAAMVPALRAAKLDPVVAIRG